MLAVQEERLCDVDCGFCFTALPHSDISTYFTFCEGNASPRPLYHLEALKRWELTLENTIVLMISSEYKMAFLDAENSAAWSGFALSSWCPTISSMSWNTKLLPDTTACYSLDFTSLVRVNWICDMVRCLFLDSAVPCLTGHVCQEKLQYI